MVTFIGEHIPIENATLLYCGFVDKNNVIMYIFINEKEH